MSETVTAYEHDGRVTLANGLIWLEFDLQDGGALISLVDVASGAEMIRDSAAPRALWRLDHRCGDSLDVERVLSPAAGDMTWAAARDEAGMTLTLTNTARPAGVPEVSVQVTLPDDSSLSQWRATVRGLADDVAVTQLVCPIICGLAKLGDPAPGESLVAPIQDEAYLFRNPFPVRDGLPLCAGPGPEMADVGIGHIGGKYPGGIAMQMMAWYNDQAGLYFAAHDAGQHPKELHMGAWPDLGAGPVLSLTHLLTETPGQDVTLAYDTIVSLFHGDWYDAATIYKSWATQQWWCEKKLWDRDLADWLREGIGGVWQMSNYHIPRLDLNHSLEQIADEVNAIAADAGVPLLGLVFNWEQGGAWTGPRGFFPPREGEAEFRAAMDKLRAAGNRGFV
ncbi:MAG: hypothetical protein KKI08_09670, partial [Armatimonadetes bacterium]|nr:hypothetical protein [Armatimonadota bacterium]